MPVDPRDRIDVDPERVVHDLDRLDEPLLVVQRAMRNSHVNDTRQVQPTDEPASDEIGGADRQPHPWPEGWRGEIHASRRVAEDDRVPDQVIESQIDLPGFSVSSPDRRLGQVQPAPRNVARCEPKYAPARPRTATLIAHMCYIQSRPVDRVMTTTTIRLEDTLKARVAAAAEREGKTAHAFILDAIAQTVEQAELDQEFQRVAEQRWTNVLDTGKTVPWDDAKAYLKTRALGGRARKPAARKLRP